MKKFLFLSICLCSCFDQISAQNEYRLQLKYSGKKQTLCITKQEKLIDSIYLSPFYKGISYGLKADTIFLSYRFGDKCTDRCIIFPFFIEAYLIENDTCRKICTETSAYQSVSFNNNCKLTFESGHIHLSSSAVNLPLNLFTIQHLDFYLRRYY